MNKQQKLVQEQFLNNEEAVIKRLKSVYNQALKDVTNNAKELQDKINTLQAFIDNAEDEKDKERLLSMQQSKVYQKQYQDSLKKQISGILDTMQVEEFKTIDEYLQKCYEDGFVGTMYDLHGQNIPLLLPIDQESMVRAVQLNSKLSQGLYNRLGEDVALLKKKVTAQVSRSIATGMSYQQVAQQLAAYTNIGYNNAVRIARTEGHRIQIQSAMDACEKAKEKGADIVKQWDATLDSRTRESHQQVDGEIRELDKKFSNGLLYPADPSGGAAEVINCRCALLQRAKWALDEYELEVLKKRAEYFGLDKSDSFEEFKKKYNIVSNEEQKKAEFRTLPEIKFDVELHGLVDANATATLEKVDAEWYKLTLSKAENIPWESIPEYTKNQIRWTPPYREDKPFTIPKGEYGLQAYVAGSDDRKARDEIAEQIGGKYIGTSWMKKYDRFWQVDVYQKDGKIVYSLGKAEQKKTLSSQTIDSIVKVAEEREKLIGESLAKKGIKYSQLKAREGDDWVDAMKEYHRSIYADGLPQVLSKEKYDAVESKVLYRGIAPQSHLRKDITTNLTTQQMADGFFEDVKPFPSRGIYGDGVAYCSPSLEKIGGQYATANGKIQSGGKIIEFKLKPDAKTISYEDALYIFEEVASATNSNLLFNKNQHNSHHEVGKAMNALGYDAIIKENGDNTGIPFYVILNREALVTKEDWTTVTVTPEWVKGVKYLW